MPTALSTVARNTAHKRLADAHPEQFSALLAEERVARGLPAVPVIGAGGRNTTPRVPAPKLLGQVAAKHAAPALGISGAVWRNWVRLGVPVGREQDVADMLGLPVAVLWPQPEQPEPKPKRTRTVPDPEPFSCTDCSDGFRTRADLARHRLHTGHGHDEGAA
jgi:hypothetical protein